MNRKEIPSRVWVIAAICVAAGGLALLLTALSPKQNSREPAAAPAVASAPPMATSFPTPTPADTAAEEAAETVMTSIPTSTPWPTPDILIPEIVPDFTLPGADDVIFNLYKQLEEGPVVLQFFRMGG